jgi:hypothetical protein
MKCFQLVLSITIIFFACSQQDHVKNTKEIPSHSDLLDSAQRHSIDHALDGFEVMPGYDVKLFAAEPMFQNPTNIDIDHRGRVYVCEAYNYRPQISNVPTKFEGDRIMILEG